MWRRLAGRVLRTLARRTGPITGRRLATVARVVDPFVDVSDDYTEALLFAVTGILHRGNLYCFDHALRSLPSEAPVVEIGTFCGLSTLALAYYKRRHGRRNRLVTTDPWHYRRMAHRLEAGAPVTYEEYRAFIRDSYLRNARTFAADDLPATVELGADEFFAAWRAGAEVVDVFGRPCRLGGRISFCYIDGRHRYEPARQDFTNCDDFLEPGGFVLFDDSYDGARFGVTRVVQEVRRSRRYELVVANPNYLFRKR